MNIQLSVTLYQLDIKAVQDASIQRTLQKKKERKEKAQYKAGTLPQATL